MGKVINIDQYRRLQQKQAQKEKLLTARQQIQRSYNWADNALRVMEEEMPPLTDRAAVYFSFIKYAQMGLKKLGWPQEDIERIIREE